MVFVDSNGLYLQILNYNTLTNSQKKQITNDLNNLLINDVNAGTYDARVRISDDGIVNLNVLTENPDTAGYTMLNTIINSDNLIAINFDISQVAEGFTRNTFTIDSQGKGEDGKGTINYNINSSYMAYVVDDSSGKRKFSKEQMTTTISLGHELVHAYRFVTGQNVENLKQRTEFDKVVPSGVTKEERWQLSEELETVGLVKWTRQSNYYRKITENDLRVQLGMPKRGWY